MTSRNISSVVCGMVADLSVQMVDAVESYLDHVGVHDNLVRTGVLDKQRFSIRRSELFEQLFKEISGLTKHHATLLVAPYFDPELFEVSVRVTSEFLVFDFVDPSTNMSLGSVVCQDDEVVGFKVPSDDCDVLLFQQLEETILASVSNFSAVTRCGLLMLTRVAFFVTQVSWRNQGSIFSNRDRLFVTRTLNRLVELFDLIKYVADSSSSDKLFELVEVEFRKVFTNRDLKKADVSALVKFVKASEHALL